LVGALLTWWSSESDLVISTRPLISGAVASLFLYVGGLFMNDVFDRREDVRDRPDRPIPSGAVRPGTVAAVGCLCLALGIGVAWAGGGWLAAATAAIVAGLVVAYDGGGKRVRFLGPALMAACRAGSVLLGSMLIMASSRPSWGDVALTVVAAAVVWLFIFFVTIIAANETSGRAPRGVIPYLPALAPAIGLGTGAAVLQIYPPTIALLAFVAVLVWVAVDGSKVAAGLIPVPRFIGLLIRKTILFQGAWGCWVFSDEPIRLALVGATVALLYGGAGAAARKFYGS
jgi:4-hydroxybenzoate polyprenyltransferase